MDVVYCLYGKNIGGSRRFLAAAAVVKRKGVAGMNMTEVARLVLGLRAAGWSEKEINDFVLYIESGEEQYKPKPKKGTDE